MSPPLCSGGAVAWGVAVCVAGLRSNFIGSEAVEAFDKLKKLIADAEEDILKFDGGNKAAGTRVRKSMQDIKAAAQEIREKVLEARDVTKPS